ncbi:hypothetical protein [Parasphingorhabdus sp.]|uniref:hypothetical protein n=1 Tax=Parasphingorhabdus sp. TaxID=2709688 RepID=UPI00300230C1
MLKLAAFGAMAYAGYKYFRSNPDRGENDNAGGPQKNLAAVRANGNTPVQPTVPMPAGGR